MEINPEEDNKIEDFFFLLDRSGQGIISDKDAVLILRSLGLAVEDEEITKKGTNFNLAQFKNLYKEKSGNKKTKEDLVAALDCIFKDNNGSFNIDDLKHGLMSISGGKFTKEEIDKILEELELNKSGEVSIDDFVNKLFGSEN